MPRVVAALIVIVMLVGCGRSAYVDEQPTVAEKYGLPRRGDPPPPELKNLVPPFELVAAGGFLDGGTTWVSMRDSAGNKFVFCVSQDAFESEIPGNTLFIGGPHAEHSSSRLARTQSEANIVIDALSSVLEGYDDSNDLNRERTEAERHLGFASQALRHLSERTPTTMEDPPAMRMWWKRSN